MYILFQKKTLNNGSHPSHPGYPYLHNRYHPHNETFPKSMSGESKGKSDNSSSVFAPGYLLAVQDDTYVPKSPKNKFQFAYANDPRVLSHELKEIKPETEPRFEAELKPSQYTDFDTQTYQNERYLDEERKKKNWSAGTQNERNIPSAYPIAPAFPKANDQQGIHSSGHIHLVKQPLPSSANEKHEGLSGSQDCYSVTIGGIHKNESFLKRQRELETQNEKSPIIHETRQAYCPQEPTLIQSLTDERGNHYSAVSVSTDAFPPGNWASAGSYHINEGPASALPSDPIFSHSMLQDNCPSLRQPLKPDGIASVKVSSETIPTYFNCRESRSSSKSNGQCGMPGFTFNSLQ